MKKIGKGSNFGDIYRGFYVLAHFVIHLKGAMGTVYMATDKNDGKTHAIKRISLKKIPEIEREGYNLHHILNNIIEKKLFAIRIETEVKMLKYLTHPNIVKVAHNYSHRTHQTLIPLSMSICVDFHLS